MSYEGYHLSVLNTIWNYGDRIALIDPDSDKRLTFRDVYSLSYAVANGLKSLGIGKGDVLVQCMYNGMYSPVVFLGTAITGAICSGVNPSATSEELSKQIKDSNAKFVIASSAAVANVLKAVEQCGNQVKKVIVVDDGEGEPWTDSKGICTGYDELLASRPTFTSDVPIKPDDVVLLPYSSGTTGHPKGVMLTHANLISLTEMTSPIREKVLPLLDIPDNFMDIPQLVLVPFYHMTGFNALMSSMRSGSPCVPIRKFIPEQYLSLIQRHKPISLYCVPPLVVFLTKSPLTHKYDLSSVQVVTCGGASLGKELSKEFVDKFPSIRILMQGYGMTETTLTSHMTPPVSREEIRHGSIGQVLEGVDSQLVDPDTGLVVSKPFTPGEIWIRSRMVMKGYYNKPDITKSTVDEHGWLHTGDIAYFDDEGYYYIVDRIKELIKVKGLQVAPAELEDLLMSHPSIADAAVVGIPDERAGEVPRAFVVRRSNATVSIEQLNTYINERVAPYKRLVGGIRFLDAIPKSPSGKILRRVLKDYDQSKQSKL
uniref:4-coumarate--CoA ligase n=1 Tax=Plectus sambesii TaxID=2011161 RepID=A0A914W9Z0_9BILA